MLSTSPADVLRHLGALHDHLPAGVVVHDAAGRIISANRLAHGLLSRNEMQLLGVSSSESARAIFRGDGSPMPVEEFPDNIVPKTGRKLSGVAADMVDSDRTRWLLRNAYPEFDEAGKIHQVAVCFADFTDSKITQQSLESRKKGCGWCSRG